MNTSKYIKNVLHTYVRNTSCSFGTAFAFSRGAHNLRDCRESHKMLCTSCRQRSTKDMWKGPGMEKPATATKKILAPEKKKKQKKQTRPAKSIKTEVTLPATKLSITARGSALNGPSWESSSTWTNTITAERRDSTGTNRVDGRRADDDVIVLYIEDSYGADPEVRFNAKELKAFFEALFT